MIRSILFLLTFVFAAWSCFAQEPLPQPTREPDQERIRIFTEEVIFTVKVTDSQGRFDPTLNKDELLILEDGQPQQILSARRLPASVLMLISTSGELNPAMKSSLTKDLAAHLVSRLGNENKIAVLQYGRDVEMVHAWTNDRDDVESAIRNKLSSSRGANLTGALTKSVSYFNETPVGNRHLVLITDGVDDSPDGVAGLQKTI